MSTKSNSDSRSKKAQGEAVTQRPSAAKPKAQKPKVELGEPQKPSERDDYGHDEIHASVETHVHKKSSEPANSDSWIGSILSWIVGNWPGFLILAAVVALQFYYKEADKNKPQPLRFNVSQTI